MSFGSDAILSQGPSNPYYAATAAALGIPPAGAPQHSDLQRLQQEFLQLPKAVQEALLAQTQQAGTFSNTPEFQAGFQTEAAARLRGLALDNVTRQQALQRQLGLPESPTSSAGTLDLSTFQLPAFSPGAAPPEAPSPAPAPPATPQPKPMVTKPTPPVQEEPEGALSPKQQAIKRLRTGGRAMSSVR